MGYDLSFFYTIFLFTEKEAVKVLQSMVQWKMCEQNGLTYKE